MRILFSLFVSLLFCQILGAQEPDAAAPPMVRFSLKNESLLPKKISLISYQPGEEGNGTRISLLAPLSKKRCSYPVGTKLYLASEAQVDVVMAGKRIDADQPFLVVTKAAQGKTFVVD